MPTPELEILYEDNHLLVVNKPAGLPTMGTPEGTPTLLTLAKDYIKHRYHKPGNVYLGVMSRLDAPVTGVVLLAPDLEGRRADDRPVPRPHGRESLLGVGRDPADSSQRHVCRLAGPRRASPPRADCRRRAARGQAGPARLSATVGDCPNFCGRRPQKWDCPLDRAGGVFLVEVLPETGRKHQIRVQMAHHGHPLVGDRKYGSRRSFAKGIALHARRLVIAHPVGGEPLSFEASLPRSWGDFGLRG